MKTIQNKPYHPHSTNLHPTKLLQHNSQRIREKTGSLHRSSAEENHIFLKVTPWAEHAYIPPSLPKLETMYQNKVSMLTVFSISAYNSLQEITNI